MHLTCFKTKIIVHCSLIGSDVRFHNHLGYEKQMSFVVTGQTGQKAIRGPVCCQWSVSCIYTTRWKGSSYHVTCEKTYRTLKHFLPKFHHQTNCSHSRGLICFPLLDKRAVNHHIGSGGWSKLIAEHNEILPSLCPPRSHTDPQTQTNTRSERMHD